MYIEFNSNPVARTTGDCAVRAIAKALDTSWEFAYIMLALNGLKMGNLMNGNDVISATLRENRIHTKRLLLQCVC